MQMLGREREVRSTEILSAYQVQQVQQGQVQQVQEQQVQQVHQGHCSISFKDSKCSKDNEIEWSKDRKSKYSKDTCTGQSDDKSKCNAACACVVAGCFVLGFCDGNGSFSEGKLAWA